MVVNLPVVIQSGGTHLYIEAIFDGKYETVPDISPICFYGDFQLMGEKRFLYGPQGKLLKSFYILLPFVLLSRASFYRKTENIESPTNRTDLCFICNFAEKLILQMNNNNETQEQQSDLVKEFFILYRQHRQEEQHQREEMYCDDFNVGPGEMTIIADFKENFYLVNQHDQIEQEFFENMPITCMIFISHICADDCTYIKKVFTILSTCLNLTSTFVL
ncbi:MAG: hypothetical protein EZS28_003774 [Streblomastix strix]|uniref:Uncharacterized protein n=1 Tax=Streblomastix strix TaxID=222440 RepID=A0A5J4X0X6_9EUKA|nr:MAG: hypothetical protein EZS28_003774 [Streblomastix strix]